MSHLGRSEQERIRLESLEEIRKLGIDPYPAAGYDVNVYSDEVLENFDEKKNNFQEVSLAGRIMSRRIMGNASFIEIQDSKGKIQAYFRRDTICPDEDKTMYNVVFKRHLDIGDIIGVKGNVFKTQVGETSINVTEYTLLSKAIHPLPIVKEKDGQTYDAFTDPEQRYRNRSMDLVVNPHIKDTFVKRTQITNSIRNFLNERGYQTRYLEMVPESVTEFRVLIIGDYDAASCAGTHIANTREIGKIKIGKSKWRLVTLPVIAIRGSSLLGAGDKKS